MFKICLSLAKFNISKIESSLKVLSVDLPTTKKEIKTKYLQLAKKLHPDIKDQKENSLSPEMLQRRNQAFIQITKAYKLLNQLSENQINNPKSDNSQDYFDKNPTHNPQKRQNNKPTTPEQRIRRETYAYFNRRYKRQNQQYQQQKKQPLYRQLPQLFLGLLFVAAFLVEWGYTAIKRSALNISKNNKQEHIQAIQGLNFKRRFDRNPQ